MLSEKGLFRFRFLDLGSFGCFGTEALFQIFQIGRLARGRQGGFGFFHESFEHFGVADGQFGQHFAVHENAGKLQTEHETAVFDIVFAAGGIDAENPQLVKMALFKAVAFIGVPTGMDDSRFSEPEDILPFAAETFGQLINFFMAAMGRDSTFYSGHFITGLMVTCWAAYASAFCRKRGCLKSSGCSAFFADGLFAGADGYERPFDGQNVFCR